MERESFDESSGSGVDHDSQRIVNEREGTIVRFDEERERTYFGEPLSLPFPPPPLLLRCPDISKTFYFYEGSPTPSCSVYDLQRSWRRDIFHGQS